MTTPTQQQPHDAPVWGPVISIGATLLANVLTLWAIAARPRRLKQLFVATNRRRGAENAPVRSFWAFDVLDPNHLVESPLRLPPLVLVALHLFVFSYFAVYVAIDMLYVYGNLPDPDPDIPEGRPYGEWLSYYTNWSITLLGAAALVAAANTARCWRRGRRQRVRAGDERSADAAPAPPDRGAAAAAAAAAAPAGPAADGGSILIVPPSSGGGGGESSMAAQTAGAAAAHDNDGGQTDKGAATQQQPGGGHIQARWDALSVAHCLLLETATSAAFMVAVWYFAGVVGVGGQPALGGDAAATLLAHAGNVFVAALQVALTRVPFASYHFIVLLWWGTAYLIVLWIYGASTGIWRYRLDIQYGRAAGAVALTPVFCFITYLGWFFMAALREGAIKAAAAAEAEVAAARRQRREERAAGEAA